MDHDVGAGLAPDDGLVVVLAGQRFEEIEVARFVAGRVVTHPSQERRDPLVVLDRKERRAAGLGRGRNDRAHAPAVADRGAAVGDISAPIAPRRVAEIDPHLRLRHRWIPERLEPARHLRSAPGCVDHEIGRELSSVVQGRTTHGAVVDLERTHHGAVLQDHIGERAHPTVENRLEEGPRHQEKAQGFGDVELQPEVLVPEELAGHVHQERPRGLGLPAETREQILEDLHPADEQVVDVVPLRNPLARPGGVGFHVALEQGHPIEAVREGPCRQKTRDTRAENDRVRSVSLHRDTPRPTALEQCAV